MCSLGVGGFYKAISNCGQRSPDSVHVHVPALGHPAARAAPAEAAQAAEPAPEGLLALLPRL